MLPVLTRENTAKQRRMLKILYHIWHGFGKPGHLYVMRVARAVDTRP